MISTEEREEIIEAAVERTLLSLPGIIGNLIVNHAMMLKNNKKFYDNHPDFKDHKDLVAGIIEITEGNNTLEPHEKILERAVPEIRKRLLTLKNLDTTNVSSVKPDLGEL